MSSLPRGFKLLPVSKYFLIFNLVVPVIFAILGLKYVFYLSFRQYIYQWGQVWRVFTNQLSFTNESQVFFSSIIFYHFRCLERLQSPHNYASFLVLIYLCNMLVTVLSNIIVKALVPDRWNLLQYLEYSSGPFPVFGALLFQYYTLIPVTYRFEISEILPWASGSAMLSDKSFVYALSIQLTLSDGLGSLVPVCQGALLALLIQSRVLPGKNWKLPFFNSVYRYFYKSTTRRVALLSMANENSGST